jgi:hypothetical protein
MWARAKEIIRLTLTDDVSITYYVSTVINRDHDKIPILSDYVSIGTRVSTCDTIMRKKGGLKT